MFSEEEIRRVAASGAVYQQGCAYFEAGSVLQLRIDGDTCEALGKGNALYRMRLRGQNGMLQEYNCTCAPFRREGKACKHIVATAKLWQRRAQELGGEESSAVGVLFRAFAEDGETPPVELRPICEISGTQKMGRVCLRFTIGAGRQYMVQDVKKLAESIVYGKCISYGKEFTFDYRTQRLAPRTKVLCRLLATLYADALAASSVHCAFEELFRAQELSLRPLAARRFFECMGDAPFDLYVNRTSYPQSCIHAQRPPLRLHLSDAGHMKTALYLGEEKVQLLTEDACYVLFRAAEIYQVDEPFAQVLLALFDALERSASPGIEISAQQTPHFLRCVLPRLEEAAAVAGAQALRARWQSAALTGAQVCLERVAEGIAACVAFVYGEGKVNPLQPDGGVGILARDAAGERPLLRALETCGFLAEGQQYVLTGETAVCDFLCDGVVALKKHAEVCWAENMKPLRVRHLDAVTAKLSLNEENLLTAKLCWEDVEQAELLESFAAYRKKKRYHRLRDGSFLALGDAAVRIAADFAQQCGLCGAQAEKMPPVRALYLEVLARGDGVVALQPSPQLQRLLAVLHSPEAAEVAPSPLEDALRRYQRVGYRWLKVLAKYRLGGILADDMGLGKTLQAIAVLASEPETGTPRLPSLVVVPPSLLYNWQAELDRFAPRLWVRIITGSQRQREILLEESAGCDVLLTTYGLLCRDVARYEQMAFRYCFLDEAQQIKNAATDNAKAAKRIVAQARFALTGTPLENNLAELWSLFDFVLPGYLSSRADFRRRFELPAAAPETADVLDDLRRCVRPFILRRLKSEVLQELPPKIETRLFAEMTPRQQKVYQTYFLQAQKTCAEELAAHGFAQSRMKILALLTRLRQICCHPALFIETYRGSSGKEALLWEVVDKVIAAGHRALIFSQFTGMLQILRAALEKKGYEAFYLDGSVPAHKRLEMVEAFNRGKRALFLISRKAGGTGLNLTGADVVIHYDPWWNPAVEAQASDRAHRIGQTKVVQVIRLAVKNTIEEKIFALQARKKALIERVVEPDEALDTRLGEAEFRALLDL